MTNDDGLLLERFDLFGDMVRDLGNAIASNRIGVPAGCLGGFNIARPVRSNGLVAVLAEELRPIIPGLRMKPETVDKKIGGFAEFSGDMTTLLVVVRPLETPSRDLADDSPAGPV